MTVDVWRLTFFKWDSKAIYQLPTNFPHSAHFDQSLFAKSSYSTALIRRVVQTCDYRKRKFFFWKITPNPCTAQHTRRIYDRTFVMLGRGNLTRNKEISPLGRPLTVCVPKLSQCKFIGAIFPPFKMWNCVSVMYAVSINMTRAIANHADLRHYLLWNVLLSTFHCRAKPHKKKMQRKSQPHPLYRLH